MMMNPVNIGTL